MNMLKSKEPNERKSNQNKNSYSVYIHINRMNNKVYVGITSRKPEIRWQNGTAYKRNPHFNSAIKKYGWDNFDHIILHTALSLQEACEYEKYYIETYHSNDNKYGYNMTNGGEGILGYQFTDEQRHKLSMLNSGVNNPMYNRVGDKHPMFGIKGKDNPNYGRKATDEQRLKMSMAKKGVPLSSTHIQHMKDAAHRGRKHKVVVRFVCIH